MRIDGPGPSSADHFVSSEVAVFARIAVWEPMPGDDRQWVIDAGKTVPGVLGAYHLIDPVTGNGISIFVLRR